MHMIMHIITNKFSLSILIKCVTKKMSTLKSSLYICAKFANNIISFIVFSIFDILDFLLCFTFKIADFFMEAELKPCYCSNSDKISAPEKVGCSKIIFAHKLRKLHLDEISDTLYTRPLFVSDEIRWMRIMERKMTKKGGGRRSTLSVDSNILEMLEGKMAGNKSMNNVVRWSDCDCSTCNSWSSSCIDKLFVKVEGPKVNTEEDVLFIHGFISSSLIWTETVFPNFSEATKSKRRLFAFDLLGFGRSPKPNDSLYTIKEQLEMIESSVIEPYKVKSFHLVAHSLGCILALALASRHPHAIKSITLLAPPYFPALKGEKATQFMMRKIGPRRVWPLIKFGASIACWYEHISRTLCFFISKNHRIWEFLFKFITRNRMKTYLIEAVCCHTHNSAWHTLHNIICGTSTKMKFYLEFVNKLTCDVTVFHGSDDDLIPVQCSYDLSRKIPRAHLKIINGHDHMTIVISRQKSLARELEQIWDNSAINKPKLGI